MQGRERITATPYFDFQQVLLDLHEISLILVERTCDASDQRNSLHEIVKYIDDFPQKHSDMIWTLLESRYMHHATGFLRSRQNLASL